MRSPSTKVSRESIRASHQSSRRGCLGELSSTTRTALPYLRALTLSNSKNINDAAVPHLCQLQGLDYLVLVGTSITADGVARLRAAFPKCVIDWDGGLIVPNANKAIPQERDSKLLLGEPF